MTQEQVISMKRIGLLVVLGAMMVLASRSDAAPRTVELADPAMTTLIEILPDAVELAAEHQAPLALHWSPARGFHYGRSCCRRAGVGRMARVSAQRFAGIDAAAGRPVYVRGQF